MRSRGLVVAIAVILAVVAAGAVVLYTNGVKEDATTGGTLAAVIVSTQDIPANTSLDPLIEQGVFSEIQVPIDAVVDGAIIDSAQLAGQTTSQAILANEQISERRLASGDAIAGGPIGITAEHVGVSVQLTSERGVSGAVTNGANVALYATFGADTVIRKSTLRQILTPTQLQKFYDVQAGNVETLGGLPAFRLGTSFTTVLVPSVRVLSVQNPVTDSNGKTSGNVTLTLDLEPADASNIVYAMETASVWVGLLPPENPDGYPVEATFGPVFEQVVGTAK
jgi:Flp pilus assembly protein CpaB